MKVDNFDRSLRAFITFVIYSLYIGLVFFSINGNFEFFFTFDYWFSTVSTTVVSFFLRWLYSDRGIEVALEKEDKIKLKEIEKSKLITQIHDLDLVGELSASINKQNAINKLQAYKDKCDERIAFYTHKKWYKPNRLELWRERKEDIKSDDFNINIIRVKYYKYDKDEMLSSFYKETGNKSNLRKTKNNKVLHSFKANVFTFMAIAILKGIEYGITSFDPKELPILLGQLIAFTLNIYTGYNLGKEYIKIDYSSNLSDDYIFLKDFIKVNGIKKSLKIV